MRESTVERAICLYAKSKGWLVRKFTSPQHKGVCDRLFINLQGTTVYLEIKAPGEVPEPLQAREIRLLRSRGVGAGYCDNVAAGKKFLDEHENK
mgnify:CR=1 FL=1